MDIFIKQKKKQKNKQKQLMQMDIKKKKNPQENSVLVVKSYYNYNTDETKISIGKELETLPVIHQLDALQDTILYLAGVYEKKLRRFHQGEIEGKTKH